MKSSGFLQFFSLPSPVSLFIMPANGMNRTNRLKQFYPQIHANKKQHLL